MARTKNTARAPRPAARSAAQAAPAPARYPVPALSPARGSGRPRRADRQPRRTTTAVIAAAAGIGRPAARDALAALETAGEVTRTKGGKPGIPDTWTLTAPGPSGNEPAAGPGRTTSTRSPASPATTPPAASRTAPGSEEASGAQASADGDPDLAADQAAKPDGEPSDGQPAEGGPAEGSPAEQDTAASLEQDQTAASADENAPAGAPPDPALVAEIAEHIGQIQAAVSTAATVLASGGDLRAVQTGLNEIYEQAAQARRTVKAAAGGKKAAAARPGGLREKVLAHLRDHPDKSFTPHEIHKVIGHSSGAIANALDTLVKHGDAELATEKPRRFRLAGGAAAPAQAHAPAEAGARRRGHGQVRG